MKIRLDDLSGKALDYAFALALGYQAQILEGNTLRSPGRSPEALGKGEIKLKHPTLPECYLVAFSPSVDDAEGWSILGPLLTKHRISLDSTIDRDNGYLAICKTGEFYGSAGYARSATEAICHCIVSMHYEEAGDVEIPDEVNLKINGGAV